MILKANRDKLALVSGVACSYDVGSLSRIDEITLQTEVLRTMI